MELFKPDKNGMKRVSIEQFELEKHLENLINENLEDIFNIKFFASQYSLNGKIVDAIGYDEINERFVIIEYKKVKNPTVIEQTVAYLQRLLDNQAKIVLDYNEKFPKNKLKLEDVRWKNSKLIIISPEFTDFQLDYHRQMQQNIEFELFKVTRFENGYLLLEPVESTSSHNIVLEKLHKSKSITTKNQDILSHLETFSEDNNLKLAEPIIKELYKKLKGRILEIGGNIKVVPLAKYVAFKHNTNFVDVTVQKNALKLLVNLANGKLDDPKKLARVMRQENNKKIGHYGNGDYQIIIKDDKEFEYILGLIQQSFDKN
ncbi:MAG TPA: DUF5655 domain-containing protein [Nitrosopumilaceae archaeon]|nr:DUF5655 domain-containing protein [Nitrosopumilaceae archaeon]